MTPATPMSTITGFITNPNPENERFYKMITLYDEKLNIVYSRWIEDDFFRVSDLQSGIYNLRVSLPSGTYKDTPINLASDDNWVCKIELPNDFFATSSEESKYHVMNYFISARLFSFDNGEWTDTLLPEIQGRYITENGELFPLRVEKGMHAIQLEGPEIVPIFIVMPPVTEVSLLIRRASGPAELVHPIDAQFLILNAKAQSLLTLLNRGAISEAKGLTSLEEAERMMSENLYAEQLLYEKRKNPSIAAIGGYFLLKVRDYEQLHDWPENLANWFPWMADGCIIRAWQLISNNSRAEDLPEIRRLLLEAAKRGIPIYTEGLRLLRNGLTLLHYHFKERDVDIKKSLRFVISMTSVADWSKETTTLTGGSPSESPPADDDGKRSFKNHYHRPNKKRQKGPSKLKDRVKVSKPKKKRSTIK